MATSPKHEWRRLEGQLLSQAILKELRPRALALAPYLALPLSIPFFTHYYIL